MNDNLKTALDWFQENVIELQSPKPLSVVHTREGAILFICSEETSDEYWMAMLWTNFLNETGYSRMPSHKKWVSPRVATDVKPIKRKSFWRFW